MPLFIPEDYTAKLAPETMEQAITYLKEIFPDMLARRLRLRRVTAPLFVLSGTGINDDLNGVERAVSFPIRDLGDRRAEVVHSLAKWKRMKLGTYKIAPGYGLYTDMNAIRADEELDNIHSLYVDQWDWERTMRPEERNLNFLKATVETIYEAMKAVEEEVYELYPHITPILPERITFLQAEELLQEFPALTPKEREQAAARKYGALFLIGIGGELSDGQRHDHLDVAALVEELAHRGDDLGAPDEYVAHLRVHHQVDVALAVADFGVGEGVERLAVLGLDDGQRADRLREHRELAAVHRQFARVGVEREALDADEIADVEQFLEHRVV